MVGINIWSSFIVAGNEDILWTSEPQEPYANCQTHTTAVVSADPFDTSDTSRYYSLEEITTNFCNPPTYSNTVVEETGVKTLNSKFISELEKHLGQKEASANTHNTWNHCQVKNTSNESIPALLPPPQSVRSLQRKPSNVTTVPNPTPLPAGSLVQNSWLTKSVNLRPECNRYVRSQSVCLPQQWTVPSDQNSTDVRYGNLTSTDSFSSTSSVNGKVKNVNSFEQNLSESEILVNTMWISQQKRAEMQSHQYDPVDMTWPDDYTLPSSPRDSYTYSSPVSILGSIKIWQFVYNI